MIAASPATIAVCDRCNVHSLAAALQNARAGATIVVYGEQRGDFVVRRPVTLEGAPGAVLDGQEQGTVLTIDAPDVTVRNIAIRASGSDFVSMSAGIRSNAAHTVISRVDVSDTLFGIYLAKSDGSTIADSRVTGRKAVDLPERGDALRVWYSRNVRISGNRVRDARDDLIWFSPGVSVTGNDISGGRYGIHTMYSNDMTIDSNVVTDCEVGSYAMYGQRIRIERNIFADNRGSTGYGIGLKSMDQTSVIENAFVSNHAGLYLDNSPSLTDSVDRFSGNLFAYNEAGIASLPSSRNDVFTQNTFEQNYRQVAVLGGGQLTQLTWSQNGQGNYWSDYAGFDRDGSGVGEVAYQPRSAYGTLSDLNENLDLFVYSPAAKAVDFAVNALPLFAPRPVLDDKAPLMHPRYPQHLPAVTRAQSHAAYASLGLLALAASFGVLIPFRPRARTRGARHGSEPLLDKAAIEVRNLCKRYGKTTALDCIDLDVVRGETLALWGPNGSGKTTLMRCLLGIVKYEGMIETHLTLGYVPQHLPAFDMRVRDFAVFTGALRGACAADAASALREAGLSDLSERNVNELSGGQRQRVAVAVAALGSPDALLLDEPTVGLDLHSRNAIIHQLAQFKREGKTIVISSHVPEDIAALADRIAVMEDGRLVTLATPGEFTALLAQRREAVS